MRYGIDCILLKRQLFSLNPLVNLLAELFVGVRLSGKSD